MSKKKTRKKTYQRRSAATKKTSPAVWLLGGMILGLLIPGIFYLKSHSFLKKPSADFSETIKLTENNNTQPLKQKHQIIKHSQAKTHQETKNSQYQFYNLLATQEDDSTLAKEEVFRETQNIKFLLEIAKFNNFEQADELRAKLLLIGIDNVAVSKTSKKNRSYRVTAGPYTTRAEASKTQKQLKDNSINSTLIVG